MKNKLKTTAVMFAFLALLVITTGVTMAFFTYNATGETLNTITVGGITFHYREMQGKGNGISIKDALPVSDNGNAKTSDDYFEFKITSTTTGGVEIPYVVTARMNPSSDSILGDIVDMYLTEVDGGETPTELFSGTLPKYNELEQYDGVSGYTEKIIYTDTVTSTDYEKVFRLRMWIDQNTELNTGDGTSDYNNKEFSVTVNVYAVGRKEQTPPPVNPICTLTSGTYLEIGSKYDCELGNLDSNDQPVLTSFYLLSKNDTANTVNLIMEHNITEGSKYAQINRNAALNYFTDSSVAEGEGVQYLNSWTNIEASDVSLPSVEDMVRVLGNDTWTLATATLNDTTFIYNTPKDENNVSTYHWLYDYTRLCSAMGCDPNTNFDNSYYNANNEKEAYGYWLNDTIPTSNNDGSFYGFIMLRSGIVQTMEVDAIYGVRPVITLSQDKITQ